MGSHGRWRRPCLQTTPEWTRYCHSSGTPYRGCVTNTRSNTTAARQVWRADSVDGGKTWSKPYRTALPNNNSGLDVCKLPSGTLVLAYNPTTENRFPLQLAVSDDNGATWSVGWNVETEGGDVKEVSVLPFALRVLSSAGGVASPHAARAWARVSPTLETLQDPILLPPWSAFEVVRGRV